MEIMRTIWNEKGSTKTIVLAVIFGVMLALTIHQKIGQRKAVQAAKELTQTKLVDVNVDDVYTIEIYELLSKTVLAKRDGKWWVGATQTMPNLSAEEKEKAEITAWDYADEDTILQTLEIIQEGFANWELVSINRERKIDFRVGALGSKFTLLDENGTELACFDVGEKSADFTGTYVSICDSDEVYKIPGILDMVLKKSVSDWRTKQIFELEQDDVVRIEINDTTQSQPVILVKDDMGEWMGTSPYEFVPNKQSVNGLLSIFCNYKAQGFPERMGPDTSDIENIQLEVSVQMKNGNDYKLTFGKSERSPETLVMGNEKEIIYTANYQDVDNLNMSAEYLSQLDEPATEETSVEGE